MESNNVKHTDFGKVGENGSRMLDALRQRKMENLDELSEKMKLKPARKRRTRKERILASITKGMQQAIDLSKKPHKTYSTSEELIAAIFDD